MSFSHHDPQKKALDLKFFEYAQIEYGLLVEFLAQEKRQSYPFQENDGLDDDRGMIYLYSLRRKD